MEFRGSVNGVHRCGWIHIIPSDVICHHTSASEKESGWLPSLWMSFTSTPFQGTSGVRRCGWSSPRSITCTSVRWMYFPHFVDLSSFEPPERANPLVLLVFPSCMSPKFPCLFFDSLLLPCNLQLCMKLNVGDWSYRAIWGSHDIISASRVNTFQSLYGCLWSYIGWELSLLFLESIWMSYNFWIVVRDFFLVHYWFLKVHFMCIFVKNLWEFFLTKLTYVTNFISIYMTCFLFLFFLKFYRSI